MKPTISFCIPTRNRAELARDCVLHLLDSGRSDIEVIVRDNASEDHTFKLLSTIKDKRFKLYKAPENEGTRNFYEIAKLATGQIVSWLSDEDDFQFGHLDFIISCFDNPSCNVLLGSIVVGNGHQVDFPDMIVDDPVSVHLTALKFSGCGGVFVRRSMLTFAHSLSALSEADAYALWNYYPVGFFVAHCRKSTLITTSKVVVKQVRSGSTNNNWSAQKNNDKKKLPHYYPESIFDRLSSSIVNTLYASLPARAKFNIIIQLIKGFYSQTSAYKHPGLISLLQENYDAYVVQNYLDHVDVLKLDNFFFRMNYLIKKTVMLMVSLHSTSKRWRRLRGK